MIIKVYVKFNDKFPFPDKVREFVYYKVDKRKFNKVFTNNVSYTWAEIVEKNSNFSVDISEQDSAVSMYHYAIESVTFFEISPIPFKF